MPKPAKDGPKLRGELPTAAPSSLRTSLASMPHARLRPAALRLAAGDPRPSQLLFTLLSATLLVVGVRELEQISLDGFAPPFTLGTYDWGVAALHNGDAWKEHRYSMETLAMFDHDYLGVHLYAQVWDYGMQQDPDQRWQFLLFLHRPSRFIGESGCVEYSTWEWTVQREYSEWATYSVVGDDVDAWVRAPDHLRFILE